MQSVPEGGASNLRRFHASSLAEATATVAGRTVVHRRRNLLLIGRMSQHHYLKEICEDIRTLAPDITPFALRDRGKSYFHRDLLRCYLRPTLAVSFCRPRTFRPRLKSSYHGSPLRKSEEYAALERCGVPVPRWALLREGERPDLAGFGAYVVTKPDRGAKGADVKIRRASRVRWKAPETDQAKKMERATTDLVVQEFIYTGSWPVSYRVVSLFGKVLFALRLEADHGRRPLEDRDAFGGGGISIVSNTLGSSYTLLDDEEIIDFGERTHSVFPEIPLLGVDIVRDYDSGKLYVLEVNPDGWSWLFKSTMGRRLQETCHIDFDSQFRGIRKTSLILIDRVRHMAR